VSWTKARSRIALYKRDHPDQPIPVELYQDLKAARLLAHVQEALSSAPAMTVEQRAEIAASLLRGDVA
jgi:hypothetical protein